jgi:hypothetical protein
MKNKQVITTGKQSRRDYRSVERNTPTQSGMPGKAGAMRFYRTIFPTGMGQSANNLLQVIYFTLLNPLMGTSAGSPKSPLGDLGVRVKYDKLLISFGQVKKSLS